MKSGIPVDRVCARTKPLMHGYLDHLGWQENRRTRVAGWIFHEDVPVKCLDVALDGHPWLSRVPMQRRPDVLTAYRPLLGDRSHLVWSGFDLTFSAPEGVAARCPAAVTLTPYAENGSRLDPFVTYSVGPDAASQPPLHLQDRVGGSKNFVQVARALTSLVLSRIEKWKSVFEAESILDWGCGCGRVIGELMMLLPPERLHGCDIDGEAIAWDLANLRGPSFTQIEPYPPTPYPHQSFDIVYGISVMTHLAEATQRAWLEELRRITRPRAVLALSVIGRDLRRTNMPANIATEFEAKGFAAFVPNYSDMLANFSDSGYYQEAYHSFDYVCSVWSEYFELLEYVETGHQDLVLLRRRGEPNHI